MTGGDPPRPEVRIAVVDDDRMLLDGLQRWLDDTHVTVVHAVAAVPDLLGRDLTGITVALLDLRLADGSHAADNVRALTTAGLRVLMVSTVPNPAAVAETAAAGCEGYITKDNDLPALVAAIEAVAAGETWFSPEFANSLLTDPRLGRPALSPREQAVLTAYASGLTAGQTARRLGIQGDTVKKYLERVKRKYRDAGVPTYTKLDLVDRARERGLID